MDDEDTELTAAERADLDAFTPLAPPSGFADRVLAVPVRKPRARLPLVAAALVAAASVAFFLLHHPSRAAGGEVTATVRTTTRLGDRGVAVAEPDASLTWHVDDHGAALVEQRAGNVFYRVEHGEPFVVHTPSGDVHVTGTCFRIEVDPMTPNHKMILSGAVGAALASAVLVTVYEGHVIAETRSARTEVAAGMHATLAPDGTMTTAAAVAAATTPDPWLDTTHATRDELVARTAAQQQQILQLRTRVAQLEGSAAPAGDHPDTPSEPGRLWHDPSPEKLAQWATECHVRLDDPGLDGFTPLKRAEDLKDRGLEPKELDGYNGAMSEVAKQWQATVRALYLEATGDTAGAETLSLEAMRHEIQEKSPRDEMGAILEKLARERAGLQAPPAEPAKTSPLERLMRALSQIGDQAESALAKRIGDKRAHELRGDAWQSRSDFSGCNKHD